MKMDITKLQLDLELPLGRHEKWAHEFPPGLATLGVHEQSKSVAASQIAEDMADVIELWRNPEEIVYAFPQNVFFGDQKKLRVFIDAASVFGVEGIDVGTTSLLKNAPFSCGTEE